MTQQKQSPLSVKISIIKSARETTANIWAQGQPTSCILPIAGGGGEGTANFSWYGLSSQTSEWACADLEPLICSYRIVMRDSIDVLQINEKAFLFCKWKCFGIEMLCMAVQASDRASWLLERWKINNCTNLAASSTTVELLGNCNKVITHQ